MFTIQIKKFFRVESIPIFLFLIYFFLFYGKVFFNANDHLFSPEGDGLKNYYTYAYYVKNNKSASNFEGFNYPYGENILYTDSHPILIFFLKPIASVFPFINDYLIGILNSIMLFSIILSFYILYKLLLRFGISKYLAAIGSLGISVLSPQLFRLLGHFSLTYSFVIPLGIYLIMCYLQNNQRKKYWSLLGLLCLGSYFIHVYLGMIYTAFILSFALVHIIFAWLNNDSKKPAIGLISSGLFAMVLFVLFNKVIENHSNRSTNPYGFFEYYADFDTVFLPNSGPLKDIIFSILPPFTQTWEGMAYIGIGTIILLPFLLVKVWSIIRINKLKSNTSNALVIQLLISSTLLLIFSFGIPFRFGLEGLLESFSFLKQFRSIGRFAWPFYFCINFLAIFLIQGWTKRIAGSKKIIFQSLLPLIMVFEGLSYNQVLKEAMQKTPNHFKAANKLIDLENIKQDIDLSSYQALIPLPFFCTGSENHNKEGSRDSKLYAYLFSFETGIPILSVQSSRTSIKESRNIIQVLAPKQYEKYIVQDIKEKMPFLILRTKDPLTKYESELMDRADLIYEGNQLTLYAITHQKLLDSESDIENIPTQARYLYQSDYRSMDSTSYFYYDSFEGQENSNAFRGTSAKSIDKQKFNWLASIPTNSLTIKSNYIASIWLSRNSDNCGQDDLNHLQFVVRELKGQEIRKETKVEAMSSPLIIEDWTLVELDFQALESNNQLEFSLIGNNPSQKITFADDLMIREADVNFYKFHDSNDSSHYIKNNHLIRLRKN